MSHAAQFREKFIARVPASIIEAAQFSSREWQRSFNIACWVRFRSPRPNRVALQLHFTDDEGTKVAEIDHCNTELETSLLLSSRAILSGKGKVKDMSLYLQVSDNSVPYVIDELYVQNDNQQTGQQEKIISLSA